MAQAQLTITKYDHAGQARASYPGVLVHADDEQVAVRTVWQEPPWSVGPLTLATGGILVEHYYRGRWFNIMELYSPSGVLLGWYCNVTRPAAIESSAIRWFDLALDLLVLPDGSEVLLDRDEFAALELDVSEREQADRALATLRAWVCEGHEPFHRIAR